MIEDEIVKEVRDAREAYAAQFDFDLDAMVADLRAKDQRGDWPVVRRDPLNPGKFIPVHQPHANPVVPERA